MVTEFSREELAEAASDFMRNMAENAELVRTNDSGGVCFEQYVKAVVKGDFDDEILYGMAVGKKYSPPEEYACQMK